MQIFKHKYLKEARSIWAQNPNGGAVRKTLVLVPNVPTDPGDPAFDKQKLDELMDAAIVHAKGANSPYGIEIWDR